MAIWQYRVDLLPQSSVIKKFGSVPFSIPITIVNEIEWWTESQSLPELSKCINSILQPAKSWSPSVYIWGEEDSNNITIVVNDFNQVEWVSCYIDARTLSLTFVSFICDLAAKTNSIFLISETYLIPPQFDQLIDAITNSKSSKFVGNPTETLRSISNKDDNEIISWPHLK